MQHMNVLAIYPHQFASCCVNYLEPRPNSIIEGYFSKLMFGDELFLMNGLTVCVPLHSKSIYHEHLTMLHNIEHELLFLHNNAKPTGQSKMVEYLMSRFNASNILAPQGLCEHVLIKISGVWENKEGATGLSFRCTTI